MAAEVSESVAIPIEQEEDKIESSSPLHPTHFLCPPNFGALLESTTVSIVSGGWKEAPVSQCRGESELEGVVHEESEECTENVQFTLKMYSGQDTQESRDSDDVKQDETVPSNSLLPQLLPPAPFHAYTMTPPLSRPSLLSASCATITEPNSQCCNSEIELHRHQLCIAIDEDSPVKYTPSVCHNQSCGSQRNSVCSSAINEGDALGVIKHDIKTHSRNVSETPSLPPFHSSSTSSAYHSRNSSLGSQLSSCFESDSMLNQLTDIDSCLAVHTGSHGDLKHLIRKHDSRFSRQGDSSPASYSSDISLHQHMSKPLSRKGGVVNLTPMNLEDTLLNLSVEKFDECKKNISMKSSEWIKHQLECHRDSLVIYKVSSKTKHVVHFNVKAGDVIIWEFATKKKDIAFGVFFEATEVATEQLPLPDSHEYVDHKMSSILPIFRVGTHAHPTIGTHTASQDGIYEIIFDNTYSRFFAKELYYRITTQPSEPNANYLQQ